MTIRNSIDGRLLKWGGLAMALFLGAAFISDARSGTANAATAAAPAPVARPHLVVFRARHLVCEAPRPDGWRMRQGHRARFHGGHGGG